MGMKWLVAWIALIVAGCSAEFYAVSDIRVEGISQQAEAEAIYFSVLDGSECAGVRVRSEEGKCILTFVRADSGAEIDCVAVVSDEPPWRGMLCVEVPIDAETLASGGELSFLIEGGGQSGELGTVVYPRPAPVGEELSSDAPSPGD